MKRFIPLVATYILVAALSGCVQKEHLKKVTFTVAMHETGTVSEVGIRGQFTSPPWEVTVPMSDADNDGVYEVTLEKFTAQSSVEFKFVIDDDQYELECQPNRVIRFTYQPEEIVYSGVFDEDGGEQENL